jgi:trimethyllysine dioxygenase
MDDMNVEAGNSKVMVTDDRSVTSLRVLPSVLEVSWDDGLVSTYLWIWLRDHAHDESTLHPVTQQRQLFTAALSTEIAGTATKVVGDSVAITWNDTESDSLLPISFLAQFRRPRSPRVSAPDTAKIRHWDGAFINANTPTVEFDEVMQTTEGLARWLEMTAQFGFSLVVNTPPNLGATEQLLRRIGYVRETIFGGMFEFTADMSKADTAYTNLELRPHTDGTYSHDAPGAQMLHCLHFEGTGGESTMVDAFAIAARLKKDLPAHYETLSTVAVPGQYIGDGSHLIAERPVFRHDVRGELVQVSFNNYDRAPFLLPEHDMRAFYEALRAFDSLANDRSLQWRHVLAPGEAMLFDNWRVLHGREAYTGVRRLCGGYVNHEDMESTVRLLGGLSKS